MKKKQVLFNILYIFLNWNKEKDTLEQNRAKSVIHLILSIFELKSILNQLV